MLKLIIKNVKELQCNKEKSLQNEALRRTRKPWGAPTWG